MICSVSSVSFFFFKQKTAYEMRISDWSSDVCSSDLAEMTVLMLFALLTIVLFGGGSRLDALIMVLFGICAGIVGLDPVSGSPRFTFGFFAFENGFQLVPVLVGLFAMSEVLRSEEHTSELQSRMRISYAVLCLKKKI